MADTDTPTITKNPAVAVQTDLSSASGLPHVEVSNSVDNDKGNNNSDNAAKKDTGAVTPPNEDEVSSSSSSDAAADDLDNRKKGFFAYFRTKDFYIILIMGYNPLPPQTTHKQSRSPACVIFIGKSSPSSTLPLAPSLPSSRCRGLPSRPFRRSSIMSFSILFLRRLRFIGMGLGGGPKSW